LKNAFLGFDLFEGLYLCLGDHMKALDNIEKYRQLSENYYQLKMDASLQLTHLYMKLSERRSGKEALEYVIKAYEASRQSRV
jgi:hypothetical protein